MPQYYDPNTGKQVYYDPETGKIVDPSASTDYDFGPEPTVASALGDKARSLVTSTLSPLVEAMPDSVSKWLDETVSEYTGAPEGMSQENKSRMLSRKLFKQDIIPEMPLAAKVALGPLSLPFLLNPPRSMEDVLELLPAAGAVAGFFNPTAPGVSAIAGGMAGERGRQVAREFFGEPSATGLIQEYTGMDPDATSTKTMNVALEGILGVFGNLVSKLPAPLLKSARRSMQNLMQLKRELLQGKLPNPAGGRKPTIGAKLQDRAVKEDLFPPGSSRATQEQRARRILQETDATRKQLETKHGQEYLDEGEIDSMLNELEASMSPANRGARPGGRAASRKSIEDAESQIADEMWDFVEANRGKPRGGKIGPTNTRNVQLEDAITERRTLDKLVNRKTGVDVPLHKESQKRASDLLRDVINESFPDIKANNLRQSEMIDIADAVENALIRAETTGTPVASVAETAGRGAMGYRSAVGALVARTLAVTTTGPGSSASAAMKRFVAKLLDNPALIQGLIRNRYRNQSPQTEFLDTLEIPEDAGAPSHSLTSGPTEQGNIELTNRPEVPNPDGGTSTLFSMSFEDSGQEVLIPRVREGLDRPMSEEEAIAHYRQTGEHLGKFNTPEEATAYSQQLHRDQEAMGAPGTSEVPELLEDLLSPAAVMDKMSEPMTDHAKRVASLTPDEYAEFERVAKDKGRLAAIQWIKDHP